LPGTGRWWWIWTPPSWWRIRRRSRPSRRSRARSGVTGCFAFADHGSGGGGEPLTGLLRRGDCGGGTKAFLAHIVGLGLEFSVGFTITGPVAEALRLLPTRVWRPAYDAGGHARDGAQVAELTGLLAATMTAAGWRLTVLATNTAGGTSPNWKYDTGCVRAPRTAFAT